MFLKSSPSRSVALSSAIIPSSIAAGTARQKQGLTEGTKEDFHPRVTVDLPPNRFTFW